MTRFLSPTVRRSSNADDNLWFKSTYSTATCTCVEVRLDHDNVSLRDSKFVASDRFHRQPTIDVPVAHWPGVLDEVSGRALPGTNRALAIRVEAEGAISVRCRTTGTTLWFNAAEWQAFAQGVTAGEFSLRLAA